MISRVKEEILKGGGFILDYHRFSNTAICINFEVSVDNIEQLCSALTATELNLNAESRDLLAGAATSWSSLGREPKQQMSWGHRI